MMRKINVEFTAKNLTGNAGLTHLGRFAEKLKLPKILKEHITIQRGVTAGYSMADAVMMLMIGVLAGAKHMSHLAIIRSDPVIRKLFYWEKFPEDRTFGRIFKLFNQGHCNELYEAEDETRKKVWSKKWFGRVTLDMDSTVIGVTGFQEGA